MHLRQSDAQQRSQARATGTGLREWQAFIVGIQRHVVRNDRIGRAVGQCRQHALAVGFTAQRWRQFRVGAPVTDSGFVEIEIGRSGVSGHVQAARFRRPDQRPSLGRGHTGEMNGTARQFRQANVARDQNRLGRGRNTWQAQPRGQLAFGGATASGQRRLFGKLHDAPAERPRVTKRQAH